MPPLRQAKYNGIYLSRRIVLPAVRDQSLFLLGIMEIVRENTAVRKLTPEAA
ncbi:hypothetical protein HMPREF0080_00297 [Anaeroglobus geminatus F0357]|uniref:Uncharacterized protein n=1 Tax=Anaeroglobus geminatus F0357 TaxID=861450 RepID=G9YF86_9FIRM|nr:hypothetical protein HMPREF0080_00297 [Anaeroglobus geminatus F0357]